MRLNMECIRDILLTVEEYTGFQTQMKYPSDEYEYIRLSDYPVEEILYHVKQCEAFGLVTKASWTLDGAFFISDLSPEGHMFLANIRSDNNWSKTKEIYRKIGVESIDAIKQISTGVVSELIKQAFLS